VPPFYLSDIKKLFYKNYSPSSPIGIGAELLQKLKTVVKILNKIAFSAKISTKSNKKMAQYYSFSVFNPLFRLVPELLQIFCQITI